MDEIIAGIDKRWVIDSNEIRAKYTKPIGAGGFAQVMVMGARQPCDVVGSTFASRVLHESLTLCGCGGCQVFRGVYRDKDVAIKVIHANLLESLDKCVPTGAVVLSYCNGAA